jgi:hypothetical protein
MLTSQNSSEQFRDYFHPYRNSRVLIARLDIVLFEKHTTTNNDVGASFVPNLPDACKLYSSICRTLRKRQAIGALDKRCIWIKHLRIVRLGWNSELGDERVKKRWQEKVPLWRSPCEGVRSTTFQVFELHLEDIQLPIIKIGTEPLVYQSNQGPPKYHQLHTT